MTALGRLVGVCCLLCVGVRGYQLPLHWGVDDYSRLLKGYQPRRQVGSRAGRSGTDNIVLQTVPGRRMNEIREQVGLEADGGGMNGVVEEPVEVLGWKPTITLGEVAGVAVDNKGDPVVLHRGGRTWGPESFNSSHYMLDDTLLPENIVVTLDQFTGQAKRAWGAHTFLMPHGINIDAQGHIWITDVGLHQVFKFSGVNQHKLLTIGQAEEPGTGPRHFCQPTSSAVTSTGIIFVADGYCNNRIAMFNDKGEFIGQFGDRLVNSIPPLSLPHGLTLDEYGDALCAADREGDRIVCYSAGLRWPADRGLPISTVKEVHGRRVFDVAALGNGVVVGVSGSTQDGSEGVAFTANMQDASVNNLWRPRKGLHNPHAIAVSPDRNAIYIAEIGPNTVWKFSVAIF